MMSPSIQELFEVAQAARNNAYAPYSHCKVGAAVRTEAGQVYSGCNIENASYSATICAERVAISAAVTAERQPRIVEVVVVSDAVPPWPPCGVCRQVIIEFGPDCVVSWTNLQGEIHSLPSAQLLPHAFEPQYLGQS